ncbi:aspartate kinase [Thermoflavimicrobium dichotomicum]|uniref:Aspartokinase n=1 Tax=Thermoflavimicrobium dichotomicum TaxID=46223 RepID=A0A1I3L511_9BACL|nr:aspartate kinase [Thermoflavimicrobium dichotomicum]SFI79807.1 aspartate kinase [Thermoflavimicrobium dichotomicum]
MGLVVQKYGGTSVGSVERIKKVAEKVAKTARAGHQCVVVVSAMGHTTDELVSLAQQISDHPSPREMDMLLSTGEQVSIALLTMALQEQGLAARSMTGWQAGIQTNAVHGKALVQHVDTSIIKKYLDQGEIVVVAGFQGISEQGEITTLGRGGSDTSAVVLAAALSADCCEIYTDVTGVFTADPRVVSQAQKLEEISYEEMVELARLGAGVLHPRSVECAMAHRMPLVVRSSFVDEPGTWVKEANRMETTLDVRGVAHDLEVACIKVNGLPKYNQSMPQLFQALAKAQINVDMIVQSERDESALDLVFSVDEADSPLALQILEEAKSTLGYESISCETGLAKVSAVGVGMMKQPGVAAKMFQTLSEAGIHIKLVSTSEIKISCVVEKEYAFEAVRQLHTAFGLDVKKEQAVTI